LSLRVVEVGGHGDDSLLDGGAEVGLRGLLHLGEHEGADLRGGVLLASGLDPGVAVGGAHDLVGQVLQVLLGVLVIESATNQTLGSVDGVLGVLHGLTLGNITDEAGAVLSEGDDRGRSSLTFGVLDDLSVARLHDSDAGVGGAQIDTDNAGEVGGGGVGEGAASVISSVFSLSLQKSCEHWLF